MQSLIELVQQINLNTFETEDSYWVDVTHIINPHDFYIRPRSYNFHMPELQAPGNRIMTSKIQPGVNIIFKSKIACTYIRGKVQSSEKIEDTISFTVIAPDYGFIEMGVLPSNIFNPYYNCPVPPLATKCKLANCEPLGLGFSDKAIDAMKYYIGKERARMTVKIKLPDILVVELLNSMPDDIATLLAITGYTHLGMLGTSSSFTHPVPEPKKHYYEFKNIKIGEKLNVRVLTGNSLAEFYVAEIADHKKYIAGKGDFNYHCKFEAQLTAEQLIAGQPVAVMDQCGAYERAIIKKITAPETKAVVQLVDLGVIEQKHIMWLKPLKSEYYFQRAASAIFCAAEPMQISDNRLDKYLLPGTEFVISIQKVGDGFQKPHIVTVLPKFTQ